MKKNKRALLSRLFVASLLSMAIVPTSVSANEQVLALVILGIVGSKQVSNGIWFDMNYLYGIFGGSWGWQ